MLEVIVAEIYSNLMSVYSGCHNFSNRSCASLCIIHVSRDQIVKNIFETNRTVQKTVETIEILTTNVNKPSAMNLLEWQYTVLRCRDKAITSLNDSNHGGRVQTSHSHHFGTRWRRIGASGPFSEINFTFCGSSICHLSSQTYSLLVKCISNSGFASSFNHNRQVDIKCIGRLSTNFGVYNC